MDDDAPSKPGWRARAWNYVREHMRRPEDTENDVGRKSIVAASFVAATLGNLLYTTSSTYQISAAVIATICFLFFLWVWIKREATERFHLLSVMMCCVMMAWWDVVGAALKTRNWPLMVVLIDVLLVIDVPRYMAKLTAGFVLVWLFIVELEDQTRMFGLFDLPETPPYAERRRRWECEKPPCATGDVLYIPLFLAGPYFIFLMDFILTRGFADKVMAEKNKMAAAVTAAEDIARSLAGFDLETAGACLLRAKTDLPLDLYTSLEVQLENLRAYRPYLPNEFFVHHDSAADGSVPGITPDGVVARAAIVFTDIRQSTALWCHSGDAMKTALDIHDSIMRTAINKHGGYEVKTIGDAFMVAFARCESAVGFALEAQTELARVVWPEGLSRGEEGGAAGFDVLEVRIGVHYGEVNTKSNPVSRRYDYFGTTVNTAARVEPQGAAGAVTVSEAVIDVLPGGMLADADVIVVPYAGVRRGKGLQDALRLTALLPRGAERKYQQVLDVCEPVAEAVPVSPNRALERRVSVTSSVGSAESLSTHLTQVARVTLCVRSATVCSVLVFRGVASGGVESSTSNVAQTAAARLQAIDRVLAETDGHLSNLMNNIAVMSWNVYRPARSHAHACTRFVKALTDRVGADERGWLAAGIATGQVSSGEVAVSQSRHFINIWGPAVDLSVPLAYVAARREGVVAVWGELEETTTSNPPFAPLDEDLKTLLPGVVRDVSLRELKRGAVFL
eukprot:TRINITY_DN5258_c0_g4_i1.p1 TRINITY_DN5258_c0_g4~~TRINITY_DN5258_c0_g4_i1.p1  ORF type:complete len:734 (+),score=140.49 TRINITY_DN5258_c0_g4_i1:331-2532(+)